VRFLTPWLWILIAGIVLFFGAEEALRITNNPNFFPTVLLVGAFTIPIAFVSYFYDHVRDRDISLALLTTCFIVGGTVGLIAAGFLEYKTLQNLNIFGLVGVGFIEESVKLIFPIAMYITWRYRHEADGLIFGMAAGMGFAALETMGYGLVGFIQSNGNITALDQVLVLRGFLSPAGHAAWTGFLCAVLWRERERRGHIAVNWQVIGAFILAVVLHILWDVANSLGYQNNVQFAILVIANVVIAGVSLLIVIRRYLEARKDIAALGGSQKAAA
jgi:RsiW-degrading membrane proteinase PrsW (M82 family)